MRKLASIKKIDDILPIDGADRIELVVIRGWQCIVNKGQYQIGDKIIFCEIDSFLPIKEEYKFLRTSSYRNSPLLGEGFRIKSMRMKGKLSQGLVLPLSSLEQTDYDDEEYTIDDDVTEFLGICKWEVPEHNALTGNAKGVIPHYINKTDQERIQNIIQYIKKLPASLEFGITEKLDGSSMTVFFKDNNENGVCSRNNNLKIGEENKDNAFVSTVLRDGWLETLEEYGKAIAVQGELIGPKIQGNSYQLSRLEFYVFDIWLIDDRRYATLHEVDIILDELKQLNNKLIINRVPLLSIEHLPTDINTILKMAEGKSILNNKTEREGIVFKSTSLIDEQVFSFKSISNKFLLKERD